MVKVKNEPIYERLVHEHGLSPAHKIILNLVPDSSQVLEVGSSSGYLTFEFKKKGCKVGIVESDQVAFEQAKKWADLAVCGSIEDLKTQERFKKKYDVIVCADVLEHLAYPEKVLRFLEKLLKEKGVMIISIPNVAFWDMRKQLFFKGDFSYQESGLMDRTHLRFYSLNNFLRLLKDSGFEISEILPAEARFPFEYSIKRVPVFGSIFLKLFKQKLISAWPNLTYYHYVVKASK